MHLALLTATIVNYALLSDGDQQDALAQCPERQPACVSQALIARLAAEPQFGVQPGQVLSRLAEGTLASELADLGVG